MLWDSVPAYLRRLDGVLTETVGKTLPIHAAPVVFASWMGGDRYACVTSYHVILVSYYAAHVYLSFP